MYKSLERQAAELTRQRQTQELIEAYDEHNRLGKRRWLLEKELPAKCWRCGDTGFFLLRAKRDMPDPRHYHVVPDLRPDSNGYWLCICDCSWDEAAGKIGPQTTAGLAQVKALFTKQKQIEF